MNLPHRVGYGPLQEPLDRQVTTFGPTSLATLSTHVKVIKE